MKRIIAFPIMFLFVLAMQAQKPKTPFDAERYRAEMEQYITTQAGLTPQEAASFYPVFEEMHAKQRAIFRELSKARRYKPATDEECRKAIQRCDELEIEMKQLRQNYHTRFLKYLSAGKLFDVLKAEDRFHRQQFKKMSCEKKH